MRYVLDAFSWLDAEHPVRRPGTIRYLLAPRLDNGADLSAFRAAVAGLERAAGGLLPVSCVKRGGLASVLGDPWWKALLLAPDHGAVALEDAWLFERLAEAGRLPLVVECGLQDFSRPPHLHAFLERCPPRPLVLTHGGQLNISGGHLEAAAELFRSYPHTLLETSGIYRQDFLESMLAALGAERILYGSGYPQMDEALELERVRILPASEAERAAMLGGNARRLFGL